MAGRSVTTEVAPAGGAEAATFGSGSARTALARRFVDVDGLRTQYFEAGSGSRVVLLHGGEFGACSEVSWQLMLPALAERHHVVAPDWLGFGGTAKVHDFELGRRRRFLHMQRFLEVMGIERAHLVGTSMGGTDTAQVLAAEPGFLPCESLTLMSSGGFSPDNEQRRMLLDYDCTHEGMRRVIQALFHDPRWARDDDYVAWRRELSLAPGAWECTAAPRFKNPTVPPRPEFGREDRTPYERIDAPVLVIAGGEDRLKEQGYAHRFAERMTDARVHVLAACGHCPNLEQAERTTDLVLDFLAEVDARP